MKYKVGDRFLSERKIVDIDISRSTPYLLMGCGSGWMSEKALDKSNILGCDGCKYKGKRHQKCSCCVRNMNMKDEYEYEEVSDER